MPQESTRTTDFLYAVIYASALMFVGYLNFDTVLAQTMTTGASAAVPEDFWRWAIQQGGAFVVVLIILFFYRRDWKTAVDFWKDQHAVTTGLIEKVTSANVEMTAALRENTVVTHSLKRAMEYTFPPRRAGEKAISSRDDR